ncbi:MAG: TetR/AcrR family transcriptional regulator [Hyphomicrobiaceae bacterium]
MAEERVPPVDNVRAKTKYHHGDLRESLISAAFQIVAERGAEHFSLADACRLAGVSTAAPYKHFRDRDEILEQVVMRAFDVMSDRSMEAVVLHGEGTLAGITAMGEAYIDFAVQQQALFRLMFGQHPTIKKADCVLAEGRDCFGNVIEQVAIFCDRNKINGDATDIAVRLWTFVHGAASLTIDEDYDAVVPDFDVKRMVREATPLLLNVSQSRVK